MKKIITELKNSWHEFNWRSYRSINSFKTGIACLLGFLVIKFTTLTQAQWIVVSILVVMSAQSTIGGLLIKSYMRFWGTLLGAVIAATILLFFGSNPWYIAITLFVTTLGFAYIAGSNKDISAAGTIGAVTTAIILLTPNTKISGAGVRFIEILTGLIIAVLVSRFILPIRARTPLKDSIAETLLTLQQYYQNCLNNTIDYNVEIKITTSLPKQQKLIQEIIAEPGKHRLKANLYQQILDGERRIFSAIRLMGYSIMLSAQTCAIQLNQQMIDYLGVLSQAAKNGSAVTFDPHLAEMQKNCESIFKKTVSTQDFENNINMSSLIFLLRYLINEMQKITVLVQKLNTI
jgi:uncharacterized membrane protein YgaE (UPF0421/DUF939 family)